MSDHFWSEPVDITNLMTETEIIFYSSIGLILLAIILWMIRSFFIRRALFNLCGVATSNFRLLGTNLTGFRKSFKLEKDNLYDYPGAIFIKKDKSIVCVCQYNPRDYKGRVKVRERYQMLLFMGIVMEQYKPENIRGAIRYNDHQEFIKYESETYEKLLDLQDEYSEAIRKWEAPNDRPLFNRDNKI